jgi:SAM-dependent methyltransferase
MTDPKRVVRDGYDAISDRYTAWSAEHDWAPRREHVKRLVELLPSGAHVLELGCGAGIPATVELARHFDVTGVDISAAQLGRARENVPAARFVHGDIASVDLPEGQFDAVAAFYSLTHVPREEQPAVLARVARWLRPGGLFVASLGAHGNEATYERDWHGATMFFSSFDADTNLRLVNEAGFGVIDSAVIAQDEGELGTATFCWVVARRRGN